MAPNNQETTTASASRRNWTNFWRHHLGEWHGRWTRYEPSGEVMESFESARHFTADAEHNEVHQRNRYLYDDGKDIAGAWDYNVVDHSLSDGFAHPAHPSMRGFAFEDGAATWLIPRLDVEQFAAFELFLAKGETRHSVGLVYGQKGALVRTASIREHRGSASTSPWTKAIAQVPAWQPDGEWHGEEWRLRPDLSLAATGTMAWTWVPSESRSVYFPDDIILRCPARLAVGQAFSVQVIWKINQAELQLIAADYDAAAAVVGLRHQRLSR